MPHVESGLQDMSLVMCDLKIRLYYAVDIAISNVVYFEFPRRFLSITTDIYIYRFLVICRLSHVSVSESVKNRRKTTVQIMI